MSKRYVYALGFFDGVHLGHQALLKACVALAAAQKAHPAAITFENHPQSLFSNSIPPLLTALEDRRRLLLGYGMEQVRAFPVTEEVMSTAWRDFLDELVGSGAVGFVCGDDFRFGSHGEGNSEKLKEYCAEGGLPCVIVPEQTLYDTRVSSTYIRRQIEEGDMATAVAFLGHPHVLSGEVVPGRQLGRTIGIPTANLRLPEGVAVPKFGVYCCRAVVGGRSWLAVTNVGNRPTVAGRHVTVEPWLLDFEGDLYGREIILEFYRFLRPEQKFDSLEALKHQIRADAEETRRFFAGV